MSEKSSIESSISHENHEALSIIALHFFRHDKRKGPDLTEEGRMHAKGLATNADISQSIAFGAKLERTHITAGLRMAGALDEISGMESLEELKQKLNAISGIKGGGNKISSDSKLFYPTFENPKYTEETETLEERADASGTFLATFAREEPGLAKKNGIEMGTCDTAAANISSLILKYIQVAPRFTELVQDDEKDYKDKMDRYFGTHMLIGEFFLMKVMDKLDGPAKTAEFDAAMENGGFGPSEGFDVEIRTLNTSTSPEVEITFIKKDDDGKETFKYSRVVSKEILEEIAEGK
jgi:hypothetical protein